MFDKKKRGHLAGNLSSNYKLHQSKGKV